MSPLVVVLEQSEKRIASRRESFFPLIRTPACCHHDWLWVRVDLSRCFCCSWRSGLCLSLAGTVVHRCISRVHLYPKIRSLLCTYLPTTRIYHIEWQAPSMLGLENFILWNFVHRGISKLIKRSENNTYMVVHEILFSFDS